MEGRQVGEVGEVGPGSTENNRLGAASASDRCWAGQRSAAHRREPSITDNTVLTSPLAARSVERGGQSGVL